LILEWKNNLFVAALAGQRVSRLLAADGQEFFVTLADDFEQEVEALRQSQAFQRFLDERSLSPRRVPLEQIAAEIERELAAQQD
jgi:hypothetical protein